jgi:plastocyanin
MRFLRFVMSGGLAATAACGSSTSPAGGGGMPSGSVVGVTIQDYLFTPSAVTIQAGTTVQWSNSGPSSHTTTSDNGVWDSGSLNAPVAGGGYGGGSAGGTYAVKFTTPGTYPYHCTLHPPATHPGFTGTITVTQ